MAFAKQSQGSPSWLKIGECLSLLGSIAGSAVSLTSQQVIFTSAPLTLAISLNLLNRHRLEQRTNAAVTQVNKQFSNDVQSIHTSIQSLPPPPKAFDSAPLNHQIAEVQQFITNLQGKTTAAIGEVHQDLNSQVESLHTALRALPAPSEPVDLTVIEAAISTLEAKVQAIDLNSITSSIVQLQTGLQSDKIPIKAEIVRLKDQLDVLTQEFNTRLEPKEIKELKDALIDVQQRLNELPLLLQTETVALRTTTQELSQTIKKLAPRKEVAEQMAKLGDQIQSLPTPATQEMLSGFQAVIARLESRLVSLEAIDLEPFHNHISQLRKDLHESEDLLLLEIEQLNQKVIDFPKLSELEKRVENLDSSTADLHDRTQNLAQMEQQLQVVQQLSTWLDERTNKLVHRCIQDLDQVQQLQLSVAETVKVSDLEPRLLRLSRGISSQIDAAVEGRVNEINKQLEKFQPSYEYRLVINRNDSRSVLIEALEKAQEQLIIVCPWLTQSGINHEVRQRFREALSRNVCIDIGWGYLGDMDQATQITRQQLLRNVKRTDRSWVYAALSDLERLEQEYKGQFRLRLLGTHEKFLVCDRTFAMVGSHNVLTSGDSSAEREVGVYTTDSHIVEDLRNHFNNARDREACMASVLLSC